MLETKTIEYSDGDVTLIGYCAFDNKPAGKKPAVLVAHDWTGRSEFACQKAEKLAALGYVGFALDMYGNNKMGKTNDEKLALMKPLIDDRALLLRRITAALTTVKKLENVKTSHIGAIGFCFGGLCVLDLARSGAHLNGIVSFHGALHPPKNLPSHPILAKMLVLHGYDDPLVPHAEVAAFQQEMTAQKVDWQMVVYSNTLHAFTNPQANDPALGTVYNKLTDQRSWIAMKDFFEEIF